MFLISNGRSIMEGAKWEKPNGSSTTRRAKWEEQNGRNKMGGVKWEEQNRSPRLNTIEGAQWEEHSWRSKMGLGGTQDWPRSIMEGPRFILNSAGGREHLRNLMQCISL